MLYRQMLELFDMLDRPPGLWGRGKKADAGTGCR